MGRHILIELAHLAAGLLVAALLTWCAAWAYPLGAWTIHRIGVIVMIVVILINLRPLRDAWASDRSRNA